MGLFFQRIYELTISHSYNLNYLLDCGELERVSRGVYSRPSVIKDQFLIFQNRFKRGVYSHETALYLHGLSLHTPFKFVLTFPLGYNTSNAKKTNFVKPYSSVHYNVGIQKIKTSHGNSVFVYNRERTLCSLLQGYLQIDFELFKNGILEYLKQPSTNLFLLNQFAKIFRVQEELDYYIENIVMKISQRFNDQSRNLGNVYNVQPEIIYWK